MKIIIAGDLYAADEFRSKKIIDKSVIDLFENTDFRIINLEAPITPNNQHHKITKTGPHLRMSSNTVIPYLQQLNIDVVTMANNHILDYGEKGVTDTFSELNRQHIRYVGAGNNLSDAAKYLSIEKDGLKIAIINFCENEWSIAEEDTPGANPMDIIDNANQIREANSTHDKVIVIVHGGHEYYNLPSPRMQKQYRFYADQGADIVVGHHTHCISGNEVYKGVPIYYSLGNFLFTKNCPNDEWYTGFLLELDLLNGKIKHRIHPIRQQKENFKLSILTGEEKNEVLKRLEEFNEIINDTSKLKYYWKKYIENQSNRYLNSWSPISYIRNRYIAGALRKSGISFSNKKGLSLYLNLMRCESHKDLSISALKRSLNK